MEGLSYAEKLKDPRWQKVRLHVLERDKWQCTRCGCSTMTLHVHHGSYRGEPWDAPLDTLASVCEACHEAEHASATVEVAQRDGRTIVLSVERARRFATAILEACNEAERDSIKR